MKKFLIYIALFIAVFCFAGCGASSDNSSADTDAEAVTEIGGGKTSFSLEVTNGENAQKFLVKTDKTTVGDALFEVGLIAGNETDDGFFITTVNGITANYDAEGTYWVFYAGGAYAQTAAFDTSISQGETYAFKLEH